MLARKIILPYLCTVIALTKDHKALCNATQMPAEKLLIERPLNLKLNIMNHSEPNLEPLRWIWRIAFVAFLVTLFLNNLWFVFLPLLAIIIFVRVYIVEHDKTIY